MSMYVLSCKGLAKVLNLYYFLIYILIYIFKWKFFRLETYIDLYYLVLNFYQINRDGEIRTRDCLTINALIPCQRTIPTPWLKLLGEVLRYNLYYFLIRLKCTTISRWLITVQAMKLDRNIREVFQVSVIKKKTRNK